MVYSISTIILRTCFLMEFIPLQTIKFLGEPHKLKGVYIAWWTEGLILSKHRSLINDDMFSVFILYRTFNDIYWQYTSIHS